MQLYIVIFVLLSAKVQCTLYPTSNNINEHSGTRCAWSQWGYWSECSNDCGSGFQTRRRACECGLLAGACEGDAEETRKCEATSGCDESVCQFGEWSEWSGCSDQCDGLRYRKQMCQCGMKVHNDSHCKGLPVEETEVCNYESDTAGCCHWDWINNWSNANASCCPADGTVWRRQACMCTERGLSPDDYCANRGPFKQHRKHCVNPPNCRHLPVTPSSCHWLDDWSEWSPCSVNRGQGIHFRSKQCSCGDPQLCSYPAPLDTEKCYAPVHDGATGVWVENNVTTQCDTPCGIGAYWIGASCVCDDTFCDIPHCLGIPHTHRQVCAGNDCPERCEWEVTTSPCQPEKDGDWFDEEEEEEDEDEAIDRGRGWWGFSRLDEEIDDTSYEDVEDLILLDEVEKKFLEEKKNLVKKHKKFVQTIMRRCKCGGAEVNNQYCYPAMEVYEVKPCKQDTSCVFGEWSHWSACNEGIQSRTRKCPCDNEYACKGSHKEERSCTDEEHNENVSETTHSDLTDNDRSQSDIPFSSSSSSPPPRISTLILVVAVICLFVLFATITIQMIKQRHKKQFVLVY